MDKLAEDNEVQKCFCQSEGVPPLHKNSRRSGSIRMELFDFLKKQKEVSGGITKDLASNDLRHPIGKG